jgi:biopolymer transport protein ExbD
VVNIVLLLIFFFLTTGRLIDPVRPDIRLSETSELPLDALPSPILVVAQDGAWQLDGRDLSPDLLAPALAALPQPVVLHVLINRDAPAGALVAVISRPELRDVSLRLVTLRQSPDRNE